MEQPDLPVIEIERETAVFVSQDHDWHQTNYAIICTSCPGISAHASNIQPGTMLVGKRGDWRIVPEGGLKR